jgi:pilus assembly protein CpaE
MNQNGQITVLVVQDLDTVHALRQVFERENYHLAEAYEAEQALGLMAMRSVDLVIIESRLPGMSGTDLCRQIRQNPWTRNVPILMLSSRTDLDDKVAGYEAGVDDYLTKPFEPVELVHRVRILLARQGKHPRAQPVNAKRGKIIALIGTKGGVGRTTIGTNLAVALRRQSKAPVLLFDADFYFGDIALHLNLSPAHTIMDLVQRINELDSDILEQVLIPHSSGVSVLLSPRNPEDVESIAPEHLDQMLDLITSNYDYTIIDCQAIYDERALVLLEKADAILLVIKPEVGCIKNMAVFSETAVKLGLSFDKKIHIALNRAGSKSGIGTSEIERIFRRQISFQLPSAGNAVVVSVNRGIPLIMEHPNHPFSVQITRMADHFIRALAVPGSAPAVVEPERSLS